MKTLTKKYDYEKVRNGKKITAYMPGPKSILQEVSTHGSECKTIQFNPAEVPFRRTDA
jgi:ribosomal protein S12